MKIRIVLGDDHCIVREGLAALLEQEADLEVVAQASNGKELVQLVQKHRPDVIVSDIAMPILNGIEALKRIRQWQADAKMICLSVHDSPKQVLAALDSGAQGYVLKDNSFAELALAIRRVMAKQTYLSGELLGGVMAAYRQPPQQDRLTPLTPREREITQLFSEGYATQQIAARLHVSHKTVATHREHIFQKLGINSIAELTRYALREGLSSVDAKRIPA